MANPEWVEIYSTYSPAELQVRIDELRKSVSVFTQQSSGSKSYVKDLAELRGQLSAAVRVQKMRSTRENYGRGVTDFSRM